jgi:hypothetical protein
MLSQSLEDLVEFKGELRFLIHRFECITLVSLRYAALAGLLHHREPLARLIAIVGDFTGTSGTWLIRLMKSCRISAQGCVNQFAGR